MCIQLDVNTLAQITKAQILSQVHSSFKGVGTDTRQSLKGQLFIPLQGENFDGHDYFVEAQQQGAAVVLTHKSWPSELEHLKQKISILGVPDTLTALQNLASYWRLQLKAPVVAITGSVGKTSTKHFAQQIVATKYKTYASPKSFNNHWGVPLSILQVELGVEAVILEMGMSAPGEIKALCQIARPDVVLVSSVAAAHMANFKSLDGVAQAKAEIYAHSPKAKMIFNFDNLYTKKMYHRYPAVSRLSFSTQSTGPGVPPKLPPDVQLESKQLNLNTLHIKGRVGDVRGEAKLRVFGPQHVYNLMGAACVAKFLDLRDSEIWQALPKCQLVWGRGQLEHFTLHKGIDYPVVHTLFDAYNANPCSMQAFVQAVSDIKLAGDGKKILILGEMLELGKTSPLEHERLGFLLRQVPQLSFIAFMGGSCKNEDSDKGGNSGKNETSCEYVERGLMDVQHDFGFCKNLGEGAESSKLAGKAHQQARTFTGFTKFLPDCTDHSAGLIVQEVVQHLNNLPIKWASNHLIAFKASRGVALERVFEAIKKHLIKNEADTA